VEVKVSQDRKPMPWLSRPATMVGKLMSRVHNARYWSHQEAMDELWKRNDLENPTLRGDYKLEESEVVYKNGTEVRELKLYKLVDAAVVTIETQISSNAQMGTEYLREKQQHVPAEEKEGDL
jgi:hypothetical protein